ncbi:threonine-phosphate decarboxylase CobD [Thiorhodovibrio frisius]|uniref:threonine-phosphate decarboxylase n=1 Tax=Thiorhodovibrio frisius TaxID=631362 RepID=H8Z5C9_9GAMM|nr:threonine-phosphate decarboxylase CobD [Thiorhodovibrio frisius]EIC20536.1 L-threonine-O-3-phosphate decarboxylase [Thiorhodovibrio frisius]WPL21285.1 Threonine-phosphate decarboxylase [Thiorhodovibrio frisius]
MTQGFVDSCHSGEGDALAHGGRLQEAAARFGIARADWLDLSTGINPSGWPVPPVPASSWQRLPEDNDGLETAALDYYGCDALLPVAGSQAAIQALPWLRGPSRVALLAPAYAEHAAAWRAGGHQVTGVDALCGRQALAPRVDELVDGSDVLILVQPNNPTGLRFSHEQLLDWRRRLAERGGWLIVDEAFMDVTPEHSLAACCPQPGLMVLRSLGKFFGLAGARVGFVLAEPDLLARLRRRLGPWTLTGPARWVATQALCDQDWQLQTRAALVAAGQRLSDLLSRHGLPPAGGCALFSWVCDDRAEAIWVQLAGQGILTRLFREPPSLRFGLPGDEQAWQRLERALRGLG